jgi:hypothetical protein
MNPRENDLINKQNIRIKPFKTEKEKQAEEERQAKREMELDRLLKKRSGSNGLVKADSKEYNQDLFLYILKCFSK